MAGLVVVVVVVVVLLAGLGAGLAAGAAKLGAAMATSATVALESRLRRSETRIIGVLLHS
ncbi:MAG TPA: hypothetical protein VFF84_06420 [Sphingobium sp.]|nr:hypothetical protein [Sphingobium sp.]